MKRHLEGVQMKSIVLPAGTEHVQFGELAHLIAIALHPFGDNATDREMMAYGGALANLDTELLQAVKVGTLPVKNPLGLGTHTFPVGDALRRSRVMVDDLRLFVAGRLSVEIAPTAGPAPVVVPTGKKWTPETLAELKAYRETHTMPETAEKFGISEQRIRKLLPSNKPKAKPFAGLIHRTK